MASLLIAIIYLAFVSLGLPDSLLGSAWPEMHQQMNVPVQAAGVVSMIVSGGTIVSALFSERLIRRLGTGPLVALSVALTVLALFGYSMATSFWMICAFAVPYGLGAGAIDSALNNYVALNYSSRHLNWLHSFWGVGTIISPYVMSYAITGSMGFGGGYRMVGVIQLVILAVLVFTLPVWRKVGKKDVDTSEKKAKPVGVMGALRTKGVKSLLLAFLAYGAAEATVMLWASTYLFKTQGITEEVAAALGSLFFIGMTVGRFLAGFVSARVGDKNMIRFGYGLGVVGLITVAVLNNSLALQIVGFLLIGLGFAPVYPSIIHTMPERFGAEKSQAIIGVQMATAYVGTTFMPPLFGLIAGAVGVWLLPYYMLAFVALSVVLIERLNKGAEK